MARMGFRIASIRRATGDRPGLDSRGIFFTYTT